jgi:hypothetical protein
MKHNGYYLGTPNPYVDYVAGDNKRTGIIHWAYLFLDNGVVKRRSKETKDGIVTFKREDFENAYAGEYTLKEDFLYAAFDKEQQWELRTTYKIIGNQIISVESNGATGPGQIYQFHEWL